MTLPEMRNWYSALLDRARRMDEIGRPDLADAILRAAERVFEEETRLFTIGYCTMDDSNPPC